jgi:hypothetical protein
MPFPDGEWPDPYGRTRPLVKLNKTLYGIRQANQESNKELFDLIVDDLAFQASITATSLFFGGNLGKSNGVLILVYVDDMMVTSKSTPVTSIASRLHDRIHGRRHVPVPDTFQYVSMLLTRDRSKRSVAIDHITFIHQVLDCFAMTDCWKRSTPMEISYKPHAIQADEQSFDSGTANDLPF